MARKLLTTALVALAWSTAASAADLAVRQASPVFSPPAPVPSWTGFYAGVNGGGGWGTTNHTFTGIAPGLTASTGNFKVNGGVAGGTFGYNQQLGAWVLGVEADVDWSNLKGTFGGTAFGATGSISSELKWLDTIRGRLGYTWGPSMIYVTGGGAYGNITATAAGAVPAAGVAGSVAQSDTRLGWTAGAGFEYMFTPNFTGKVEYLYVDLGTNTQILVDNVKFNTNIVRGGLNWKF
jgi:outer membrane immunogenic protein